MSALDTAIGLFIVHPNRILTLGGMSGTARQTAKSYYVTFRTLDSHIPG